MLQTSIPKLIYFKLLRVDYTVLLIKCDYIWEQPERALMSTGPGPGAVPGALRHSLHLPRDSAALCFVSWTSLLTRRTPSLYISRNKMGEKGDGKTFPLF